jgi:hypothetical protein
MMTTSFSDEDSATAAPPRAAIKARWGCVALIGAPVLGLLILAVVWIVANQRANEQLASQIARIRARGEPLTSIELNDFYQPIAGRPDMTREIMTALALCQADEFKSLAAALPIVGQGPEPPALPEPWPQIDDAEAYLARQAQAIAIFREIARRQGTARFPVDFSPGVTTLLPQTQALRLGPRLLTLKFHVDLRRGNTHDAVECILAQIALARLLDREPALVSQLVRLALVNGAIENIQTLIRNAALTDSELEQLQTGLRLADFQPSLKAALAGERAIGYMACLDPNRMSGESAAVTPAEARQIAQGTPRRVHDATKMLQISLRLSEAADESLAAVLRESDLVDAEVKTMATGMMNKLYYGLTLTMIPAYGAGLTAFARTAATRDCADAVLAAERYRRRHGTWPDGLSVLVPEFLTAVPTDPFSDQPLKMIVTSDALTIYSVGRDRIDDRGTLSDRQTPHTDVGLTVPVRTTAKP